MLTVEPTGVPQRLEVGFGEKRANEHSKVFVLFFSFASFFLFFFNFCLSNWKEFPFIKTAMLGSKGQKLECSLGHILLSLRSLQYSEVEMTRRHLNL